MGQGVPKKSLNERFNEKANVGSSYTVEETDYTLSDKQAMLLASVPEGGSIVTKWDEAS